MYGQKLYIFTLQKYPRFLYTREKKYLVPRQAELLPLRSDNAFCIINPHAWNHLDYIIPAQARLTPVTQRSMCQPQVSCQRILLSAICLPQDCIILQCLHPAGLWQCLQSKESKAKHMVVFTNERSTWQSVYNRKEVCIHTHIPVHTHSMYTHTFLYTPIPCTHTHMLCLS